MVARKARNEWKLLVWALAGVAGALALAWLLPRTFPLFPFGWQVSKNEAEVIALERLRDVGDLPDDPYVVGTLDFRPVFERRLKELAREKGVEAALSSRFARERVWWRFDVFERSAPSHQWAFRAAVTPFGEVRILRRQLREEEGSGSLALEEAVSRAQEFLRDQGFDLSRFHEPETRSQQLETRTDVSVRFRDREALFGEAAPYGIEVKFAGEELTGFSTYFDNPQESAVAQSFQSVGLLQQVWVFLPLLLVPLVSVFFLRRYHAGEVGVRRGLQLLGAILCAGVLTVLVSARSMAAGWNIGVFTRPQVTAVLGIQYVLLFFAPIGVMAFLGWTVGEVYSRERHSFRLAAFDALAKGDWRNATFAREALRGTVTGILLVVFVWAARILLEGRGAWAPTALEFSPWWQEVSWFGPMLFLFAAAYSLNTGMVAQLLTASVAEKYLGTWLGGLVATVLGAFPFFPPLLALPVTWSIPVWLVSSGALVFLFLRYGIFASLLASLTASVLAGALPFLTAADPGMQLQAGFALLLTALPLLLSVRYVLSDREMVYRYDDIPPHVRRIAERERQRVELETARGIQSSILPELPEQLAGVEIAHAYRPATEVGGDFYDVLALDDGRLAVAVGDVAGHGVSSGLVMSMAKSALAVQVTFNPEVEAVFSTLNRMVFQTARKRLLTTLCYALVDPQRGEMLYASAGHLFPYVLRTDGRVDSLESVAYPLGVRELLEVRVRKASLEPGDTIFLFSDGLVEARKEGTDEDFGFERLEESLARHAGGSPRQLLEAVMADVETFTGTSGFREDDQTVLVLRVA